MFVSDKSLGEIQKLHFFNDKELPAKGSKSERLVLQFLELLSNPKAVTPHTNIFSMDKKKRFVANSQQAISTHLNVANYHAQNFHNTIKDFYSYANACDFIEVNNDLLNTYLQKGVLDDDNYPEHIQSTVFMVNFQNQFLTALKEYWELYNQFSNPKTATV